MLRKPDIPVAAAVIGVAPPENPRTAEAGIITDPADAQAVLKEMTTALEPLCECLHDARVRLVPLAEARRCRGTGW